MHYAQAPVSRISVHMIGCPANRPTANWLPLLSGAHRFADLWCCGIWVVATGPIHPLGGGRWAIGRPGPSEVAIVCESNALKF